MTCSILLFALDQSEAAFQSGSYPRTPLLITIRSEISIFIVPLLNNANYDVSVALRCLIFCVLSLPYMVRWGSSELIVSRNRALSLK